MSFSVYAYNVPFNANEDVVGDWFFDRNCKVCDVKLERGSARIFFDDEESVHIALGLNGSALEGRAVEVLAEERPARAPRERVERGDRGDRREGGERREFRAPAPAEPQTVYVYNVSYDLNEDAVGDFFYDNNCKVIGVELSRGFCKLKFEDDESVEVAMSLSGRELGNRTIEVCRSEKIRRDRTERVGGGERGGDRNADRWEHRAQEAPARRRDDFGSRPFNGRRGGEGSFTSTSTSTTTAAADEPVEQWKRQVIVPDGPRRAPRPFKEGGERKERAPRDATATAGVATDASAPAVSGGEVSVEGAVAVAAEGTIRRSSEKKERRREGGSGGGSGRERERESRDKDSGDKKWEKAGESERPKGDRKPRNSSKEEGKNPSPKAAAVPTPTPTPTPTPSTTATKTIARGRFGALTLSDDEDEDN